MASSFPKLCIPRQFYAIGPFRVFAQLFFLKRFCQNYTNEVGFYGRYLAGFCCETIFVETSEQLSSERRIEYTQLNIVASDS